MVSSPTVPAALAARKTDHRIRGARAEEPTSALPLPNAGSPLMAPFLPPPSTHSQRKASQAARPNAQLYPLPKWYPSSLLCHFHPEIPVLLGGLQGKGLVPLSYDLQSKSLLESPNQMKQVLKPMINGPMDEEITKWQSGLEVGKGRKRKNSGMKYPPPSLLDILSLENSLLKTYIRKVQLWDLNTILQKDLNPVFFKSV